MTSHTSLGMPNHYVQFKAFFNFLEIPITETQWELREELNMTVDFSLLVIKYTLIAVIFLNYLLLTKSLTKAKEVKGRLFEHPEGIFIIDKKSNMSEPHLEIERQWS